MASPNLNTKYDIYIRDKAIHKSSNDPRHHSKTIEGLRSFLEDLVPRPISSVRLVKLGYIVVYDYEDAINYYFKSQICQGLENAGLEFKLSYKTQEQRELFILDPPPYIYNKMESDIIPDLEQKNQITILHLHKFESKKTFRKYIRITLSCEHEKNRIVNNKNIKAFLDELRATPRIAKQHPSGPQQQPAPADFNRIHANNYNNTTNKYSNINNNRSTYLPSTSNWGNRNQHGNTADNNIYNNNNRNHGLMPPPPGLAAVEIQAAEMDIRIFLQAVSIVSEKLSSGMEHPEMFVTNFNSILTHNGYNTVNIPNDILECSKQVHRNKLANNQAQKFLANEFFHNPQIFQRPPPSPQANATTSNDTSYENNNKTNIDLDNETDTNSLINNTDPDPTAETNTSTDNTEFIATVPAINEDSDSNEVPILDSTVTENNITNSDNDNDTFNMPENNTLENTTDQTELLNSTIPFLGSPTSPSSAHPPPASSLSQSEPNLSSSGTPLPITPTSQTPTDQKDLISSKDKNIAKTTLRSSIRTTLRTLKKKS